MVTVNSDVTTLSFFPGYNENSSEGGDELNSSLPDVFGEAIDDWFHGDNRVGTLAPSLDIADNKDKTLEEFTRNFLHYRFRNDLNIEFTTDGQTINPCDVVVTTNSGTPNVTLEGEGNFLRTDTAKSLFGYTANYRPATAKAEHFNWEVNTVNGMDAVQAGRIWGAYDPYVEDMHQFAVDVSTTQLLIELFVNGPTTAGSALVLLYILTTPVIYTWIEHTVLADGTKLVRVWDTSPYPKHVGYLDASRRATTNFDDGEEWQQNQVWNPSFHTWAVSEQLVFGGPYEVSPFIYKRFFDDSLLGQDPMPDLAFGTDSSGKDLFASDVNSMLSPGFDVDPFINTIPC